LYDLAKCPRIYGFRNLVAIAKLLADLGHIVTLFIGKSVLVLSPYFSDGVDALVYS
jgi:hypothetical protein